MFSSLPANKPPVFIYIIKLRNEVGKNKECPANLKFLNRIELVMSSAAEGQLRAPGQHTR